MKKLFLLILFSLCSINGHSCEIKEKVLESDLGYVLLTHDNCKLTNPTLTINYDKDQTTLALKTDVISLLKSSESIFKDFGFSPNILIAALSKTKERNWELGKYYSLMCFDQKKSPFVCTHYVLAKYRFKKGKYRLKLSYNSKGVHSNRFFK